MGLSPDCSVLDLKSRFEIYGAISRIRIDRTGVGSINFRSNDSTEDAIASALDPSFGITVDSKKFGCIPKLKNLSQRIADEADEHHTLRRPLQMRRQKPIPMKLINPKFEEKFVKGRDYDPDRERAERKKLKKRVRDETKGAIRELRKDNYFLWEVKQRDKSQVVEERAEKYGKAKAFLQEQEHAFKSGQLGKGTKRRR